MEAEGVPCAVQAGGLQAPEHVSHLHGGELGRRCIALPAPSDSPGLERVAGSPYPALSSSGPYPLYVTVNEEENAILLEVLDDCFGIYFDQKIIHIPYSSILGCYEIPKMPNIFEGCFEKANNILEVYNNQDFSLKLVLKYFDVDPSLNDIKKKYFSDYIDY